MLKVFVAVSILAFSTPGAVAQASDRLERCIQARQSENAALHTEDWAGLVGMVQKRLAACPFMNSPKDISSANFLIGFALLQSERSQESIKWFEGAISQYYADPQYHAQLALAYKNVGRAGDAITSHRRSLVLSRMILESKNDNLYTDTDRYVATTILKNAGNF